MKKNWNPRMFRFGVFTIILTAVVVGIIVLLNVLFTKLPSSVQQLDITKQQMTELSDASKQIVSALKQDVTIYVIAQEGQEKATESGALEQALLARYQDLSDHIKVETMDPNTKPNLRTDYEITGTLYYYALIVQSGTRFRYVPYSAESPTMALYVTTTDYTSYDENTGSYPSTTTYEAERAITSAIDFVTREKLPKLYSLTGHGEYELYKDLAGEIQAKNVETDTLNLETAGSIPEDCDMLLIYYPQQDLSENEAKSVLEFADNGGKVILITGLVDKDQPNLKTVTDAFGVAREDGIVIEGDPGYYSAYYGPYLLMPELKGHEITSPLYSKGLRPWFPYAQALYPLDEVTGVNVTSLLNTSASAYIKSKNASTLDKEEGDIEGQFSIGLLAEKPAVNGNVPTLSWFSTQYALDCTDANINLTTNLVSYLLGEEEGISVSPKSLDTSYLVLTSSQATLWSIILIGIVPLLLVALGIFVVVRRKRQ